MSLIFLSYRRADTKDFAGRVYDKLRTRYRAEDVFFDLNAIPFGVDFREYIDKEISECEVMLALVGNQWMRGNDTRNRLLEDPEDYVRIEIELALNHGCSLIPMLVSDAEWPKEDELPKSIHELLYLNACAIDSGPNFHTTMDKLLDRIDLLIGEQASAAEEATGVLEILSGPQLRERFELNTDKLTIGRHPDCDICLDGKSVSRRHALIERCGAGFSITDTRSSNGLFINGNRVVRPCTLANDDLIQIGIFVLKFHGSS